MTDKAYEVSGLDRWSLGKALSDAWKNYEAARTQEAKKRVDRYLGTLSQGELKDLGLSPEQIERLKAA